MRRGDDAKMLTFSILSKYEIKRRGEVSGTYVLKLNYFEDEAEKKILGLSLPTDLVLTLSKLERNT